MGDKSQPKVGMKVHFPFQVSICAWVDLLGYGSQIRKADYNPLNAQAASAVARIRQFHQIVADHSARMFPTLVMNDGAAAYRDLSYRTRWPTYDFIQKSYNLFKAIEREEAAIGAPGARMVIAVGFRLRGRATQSGALRGQYVKSLIAKVNRGELSVEAAITRASQFRRTFDVIPQLQANFAFTKAYIAEQSGSSAGLVGPNLFLDDLVLDIAKLETFDVQFKRRVKWSKPEYGLSANFLDLGFVRDAKQTEKIGDKTIKHGPLAFRDALEVATHLTGDQNVLSALRKARRF